MQMHRTAVQTRRIAGDRWSARCMSRPNRTARRISRDATAQARTRAAAADSPTADQSREPAEPVLPPGGEPGRRRCAPTAASGPGRTGRPARCCASPTRSWPRPASAATGVLIGRDTYSGGSFVYDPWVLYRAGVLTNPNVLLAGVIGTGKSALAKSLVVRSIAFGRRAYVPGDPKGEWTPVAHAVGGHAVVLGQGLSNRLNPLDEGTRPTGLTDVGWERMVWQRRRDLLGSLTETVLARAMQPVEHTALDAALTTTVAENGTPTLPRVVDHLLDPATDVRRHEYGSTAAQLREDGRHTAHALRRLVRGDLAGLFDGPSTVRIDPAAPLVSLDLSRIDGSDTLLALVMTCASTWMEAALLDNARAASSREPAAESTAERGGAG